METFLSSAHKRKDFSAYQVMQVVNIENAIISHMKKKRLYLLCFPLLPLQQLEPESVFIYLLKKHYPLSNRGKKEKNKG